MAIINDINLLPSEPAPEYVQLKLSKLTPASEISEVITSGKINNMNSDEQYSIIKNFYNEMLKDIFDNGNIELLNSLFTNVPLLTIFANVMSSEQITIQTKHNYTRLCYDYINRKQDKDSNIAGILINSCKFLYGIEISKLMGIVDDVTATYMVVAVNSSSKIDKCIRRLNTLIINVPQLTEQKIVDIYTILFNRMSPLFCATMFDVKTGLDEYRQENNSMISNAILYLLDNMQIEDIKKVLSIYSEELRIANKPIRMSLHSISSEEFPRVVKVVNILELEGTIVI